MPRIRILLVDDHPLLLEGLVSRLETVPDFEVVGQAADGVEALALLDRQPVDLVLTDIRMAGMGGLQTIAALRARQPAPAVLVLSMYDDPAIAQQALAAGARGYVLKAAPSADIVAAIRTVVQGGTWISSAVASGLFQRPAADARHALSAREQEILDHLGQGQSSKHIARALDISVRTVETHRMSIRRKLGFEGQAELIRYAVEHVRRTRAGGG